MPLSLAQFVERWKIASLSESSGAQTHFIDLCDMLGQPHPAAADATGETYTFEKPVSKVYGGEGFADVWKRGHFAWEYKGTSAPPTSNSTTTAKTSSTHRCSSSATSTASRSTPTSATPNRASTPSTSAI